jgi:hypothetical protein
MAPGHRVPIHLSRRTVSEIQISHTSCLYYVRLFVYPTTDIVAGAHQGNIHNLLAREMLPQSSPIVQKALSLLTTNYVPRGDDADTFRVAMEAEQKKLREIEIQRLTLESELAKLIVRRRQLLATPMLRLNSSIYRRSARRHMFRA